MQGRLDGKVIIVAGAGGIGGGLTTRYASEGACVIVGDINPAAAEAAAREANAAGGAAIGVALDGADEDSIAKAVARAKAEFGGLDGFHANFANFRDGESGADVLGLPMDIFDDVMRVNMRGYVLCTRHAIPEMLARGGGVMLYTSSAASYAGLTVRVAYAMSKLSVHALMRHVAARFGPDGIRANALTPGVVTHPRFVNTMPKSFGETIIKETPRRRLGLPSDVAAMAAFLMSDDANFVSGQLISVDGARTMRQ